jgi:hypothetical protein
MGDHLAYDATTGHLVYSPNGDTPGHLARNCGGCNYCPDGPLFISWLGDWSSCTTCKEPRPTSPLTIYRDYICAYGAEFDPYFVVLELANSDTCMWILNLVCIIRPGVPAAGQLIWHKTAPSPIGGGWTLVYAFGDPGCDGPNTPVVSF